MGAGAPSRGVSPGIWWMVTGALVWTHTCTASLDAKRLYDDLLRKGRYSKLIRPVANDTDMLTIKFGLRLSQIIDMVLWRIILFYLSL